MFSDFFSEYGEDRIADVFYGCGRVRSSKFGKCGYEDCLTVTEGTCRKCGEHVCIVHSKDGLCVDCWGL